MEAPLSVVINALLPVHRIVFGGGVTIVPSYIFMSPSYLNLASGLLPIGAPCVKKSGTARRSVGRFHTLLPPRTTNKVVAECLRKHVSGVARSIRRQGPVPFRRSASRASSRPPPRNRPGPSFWLHGLNPHRQLPLAILARGGLRMWTVPLGVLVHDGRRGPFL